jgi:effector-binding domain-containing protein
MFDEYLKLNIVQQGNLLCGYTFDFVLKDKRSYCKTYFTGVYNQKEKIWVLNGKSFIVNSGDHVLMNLKFWHSTQGGKNTLKGMVTTESSFFNFLDSETGNTFWIRKVASIPQTIPGHENTCFISRPIEKTKKKITIANNTLNAGNTTAKSDSLFVIKSKSSSNNDLDFQISEDELKQINHHEIETETDPSVNSLLSKVSSRRNILFSTLNVSTPEIEIKVYDNGIVDNDTVSIIYNGIPLKIKSRLAEEPVVIKLKMNPDIRHNELILFAENLGGIPPNSAFITVKSGSKRYEIHANANLKENALLVFDYSPK